MKAIFVAGTDTNVGKTIVTGLLAMCLIENGYSVVTQKWVQTGQKKKGGFGKYSSSMAPYSFKFASSPHLAARLEGRHIRKDKIKRCFRYLSANFDVVIVEGTGGLLVPLNSNTLLIDVIKELNIPVLLVIENRLGAINQALLSIEALRARRIKILGMIFNNISNNTDKRILKDNPNIINKLTGIKILGILPYVKL